MPIAESIYDAIVGNGGKLDGPKEDWLGIIEEAATKKTNFTLYWKSGHREVIQGSDIADAMRRRGYGNGAMGALDFWQKGICDKYTWNGASRYWIGPTTKG